jgi:molybdopterin synthase catalytic subunit
MPLVIRLFATLKDRAGASQVTLPLAEPTTVSALLDELAARYPPLAPLLPTALVAVNQEFAFPGTTVQPTDEVALFPPVSGGEALPFPTYFAITAEMPDLEAIHQHLFTPEVGAIITFRGAVRGQTEREGLPPETIHLEYEAYEGMAERKMAQIAREIWERWPDVRGVAIVQRVGKLGIGEMTTLIACAAGHRDQGAFEAARYGIDRLKEIVPVWKKEVAADHSVWIEGDYRPTTDDLS